jgi:DNA-binding IclR family transcriptional regulator
METLGLARTTVHRIVAALCAEALVERAGAGDRFRIGPEFILAGNKARNILIENIHVHLQTLSEQVGETVDLFGIEHGRAVIVDQIAAAHRLCVISAIGSAFPLHCTAAGKALLAVLPPTEGHRLLCHELQGHTTQNSERLSKLSEEIDTIRRSGIAFDLEEYSSGVCAIGTAFNTSRLGPIAISITIPLLRFHEKRAFAVSRLKVAAPSAFEAL